MKEKTASEQIDHIIKNYGGWKGEILSQIRTQIKKAYPEIEEEVKWKMPTRPEGLPVWSHNGIVCIAETFKDNIKLVFFKGAFMKDSHGLFNARLKSKTDRAIEFKEGSYINTESLREYIKEAVALNEIKAKSN